MFSLSDLRSLKPTGVYVNLLNKLDAAKNAVILTQGQDRKQDSDSHAIQLFLLNA